MQIRQATRRPIARRLIVAVVLFSSFITLITTAIQLYFDYEHDIDQIESEFEQVETSYLESLINNVWVSDGEQIQTQLDGLLRLPDLEYLGITVDGAVEWSAGTPRSENVISKKYPLIFRYRGQDRTIGILQVTASLDAVYKRLIDKILIILLSNGVKTFLVAGFILFTFQYLVTRHLQAIADYVRSLGNAHPATSKLALERGDGSAAEDELDDVVSAVNQMQAELNTSHESLMLTNKAIEAADSGIIITDPRRDDNPIVYVNPAMENITGRAADELIGHNPRILQGQDRDQPELKQIREALAEKRPVQVVLRNYRKDGSLFLDEIQISPVFSDAGELTHFVGIQHDITERKRSEEQLRESEARLRSVMQTVPDAIVTIDARGTVESFSPYAETMFGYTADEVVGQNVRMLMPPPLRDEHDRYLARYRDTGEKRIIGAGREVSGQRKDGTVFPLNLVVNELHLGGRLVFTGFLRDLTTEKRRQEEHRQSQKMEALGQLTGGVAHDFNNLLTVVLGNLEMLEMRAGDDDRLQRLIRQATEATELGADLTGRLLAFGRRQPLEQKVVNLNDIVLATSQILRSAVGGAVQISTVLANDLGGTEIDPNQFENALLNLAINAGDAMPDGGSLVIETANAEIDESAAAMLEDLTPGDYVMLSVSDTGSGMTPDVRERAFEPFFTTKGAGTGTGLGLSMVYGFAKQSNGHALIYSEPGVGTNVKLYFPRVRGDAVETSEAVSATSTPRGRGETILVVEDDPRVRNVTLSRLDELGYRTVEAEDGPTALALLDQGTAVDLLFTDIVMPGGLSGVDLAEAATRQRPGLKILFTSGYAEPAVLQAHVQVDASGLLRKPHSLAELATKVRQSLDR